LPAELSELVEEITYRWSQAAAGRWSPKTVERQSSATAFPYLEKRLRPADEERYAAAGLLPYLVDSPTDGTPKPEAPLLSSELAGGLELIFDGAVTPEPLLAGGAGGVKLLLGRQGSARQLRVLGGKRELWDRGSLATALREAEEESLGQLGAAALRRELLGPVLWWPSGRFALYLYPAPQRAAGLPRSFASRLALRTEADDVEVDALEWVPRASLMRATVAKQLGVASFTRQLILSQPLLRFVSGIEAQRHRRH
jgi:hypothetical protein